MPPLHNLKITPGLRLLALVLPTVAPLAGDIILVSSHEVPTPVAAWHARAYNPNFNLYNADDFPAAHFSNAPDQGSTP